jgi:hypothetical protein
VSTCFLNDYVSLSPCSTDETFKAAGYIQDVLLDKESEASDNEFKTPLNRAFGTEIDLFSWYEQPMNKKRFKRFGFAMDVSRRLSPPGAVLQGMLIPPVNFLSKVLRFQMVRAA